MARCMYDQHPHSCHRSGQFFMTWVEPGETEKSQGLVCPSHDKWLAERNIGNRNEYRAIERQLNKGDADDPPYLGSKGERDLRKGA